MNDRVRINELERRLEAELRRNRELEIDLENSRRWSQAWKRAAKSELDVIQVIRNLRKRRIAVGISEYAPISRDHYAVLERKLANAQRQVEFLERERQRWMENAQFFQESSQKMRMRLDEMEVELQRYISRDGREGEEIQDASSIPGHIGGDVGDIADIGG